MSNAMSSAKDFDKKYVTYEDFGAIGDGKQEPIPYDALQPGTTEDTKE